MQRYNPNIFSFRRQKTNIGSFRKYTPISMRNNNSPQQEDGSISYTNFIQNMKHLFKKPKKKTKTSPSPLKFRKNKSSQKESELFRVIRKYIVEEMDYAKVITFLRKRRDERKKQETKAVAEFLAMKNDFFNNLKNNDIDKLYSLVSVINIETFKPNEPIIVYGEEGDKFYIVLEGCVGIYRPKVIEKEIRIKDFVLHLQKTKAAYKGELALARLESYNIGNIDFELLKKIEYNYRHIPGYKTVRKFAIEKDIKVSEGKEGTAFGEVALIRKTKRNATVIALTETNVATIGKEDYHNLMRMIEAKKYYDKIARMKKEYMIISCWSTQCISRLINYCESVELIRGEFLFRQGDTADFIYFVFSGSFEISMIVSVSSLPKIKTYINNNKANLIDWLDTFPNKKTITEDDIRAYISNKRDNVNNVIGEYPLTPVKEDLYDRALLKSATSNAISDISKGEQYLSNPDKLFKIVLRKVNANECFGVEDGFEMKKRFCTVKCTSIKAEVKKVSIVDLMYLICKGKNVSTTEIRTFITEKNKVLIEQIDNIVEQKQKRYQNEIKAKYQKAIKSLFDDNTSYKNEQPQQIKMTRTTSKIDKITLTTNTTTNNNNNKIDNYKKPILYTKLTPRLKTYTYNNTLYLRKQSSRNYTEKSMRSSNYKLRSMSMSSPNDSIKVLSIHYHTRNDSVINNNNMHKQNSLKINDASVVISKEINERRIRVKNVTSFKKRLQKYGIKEAEKEILKISGVFNTSKTLLKRKRSYPKVCTITSFSFTQQIPTSSRNKQSLVRSTPNLHKSKTSLPIKTYLSASTSFNNI